MLQLEVSLQANTLLQQWSLNLLFSFTSSHWRYCTSIFFTFFFLFFPSFPSLGAGWFQSFGPCGSATVSVNLSLGLGVSVRSDSGSSPLDPPPSQRTGTLHRARTQKKGLSSHLIVLAMMLYCCGLVYYFEIIVVMALIKNILIN